MLDQSTDRHKHSPEAPSDSGLWGRLKAGDMEALGALYDRHVDDLFAVSLYVCGDRSTAQDAIHDLFLDLYKYHKKLAPADNVRAYLITALRRRLYKAGKAKSRSLDDETNGARFLDQPGHFTESAEEVIVLKESQRGLRQSLHKALQTLTEHQKTGHPASFYPGQELRGDRKGPAAVGTFGSHPGLSHAESHAKSSPLPVFFNFFSIYVSINANARTPLVKGAGRHAPIPYPKTPCNKIQRTYYPLMKNRRYGTGSWNRPARPITTGNGNSAVVS